jgi:uncharacterized repeat protein (TIGR02543 family)
LNINACHSQEWECFSGEYLNTNVENPFCDICPINNYCPHGICNVDTAQNSKKFCPSTYPHSNEGSFDKYNCYAEITYVFNDDDDDLINRVQYTEGSASGYMITLPNATRDGYIFDGWYDSDNNLVTNNTVFSNGDITLYAKWTQDTFVCDSGVWMRIGDNTKACLSENKTTSPAMAIQVGNKTYYLQISEDTNKQINTESSMKMHIYYRGHEYNVHDASVSQ